jgi:hypothetical protein
MLHAHRGKDGVYFTSSRGVAFSLHLESLPASSPKMFIAVIWDLLLLLFVAKRLDLNVCSGNVVFHKKRRRGTGGASKHLTVSVLADGGPIRLGYRCLYPDPYPRLYLCLCPYPSHPYRPLGRWPAPGSLVRRSRGCWCPSS